MSLHARLERLERATLTGLLALPEPAQRALAGRRIVRDGQTLATDVQLSLRLKELVREPGPETLPLPEARAAVLRQAGLTGGEQPIGAVRDFEVAGRPARLYTPTTARRRRAAGLLPRRRVGLRRPRLPRRRLPVPRRAVGRAGAGGRLPAGSRAPLPRGVRRRAGGVPLGDRARRRARRRPRRGSPSAATRPAAAWPRPRRSRRPARGCRCASSCWSTRPPTCAAAPRAGGPSPRAST